MNEPKTGARSAGNLAPRILSSLVLVPLVLALTWYGGVAYVLLMISIAAVAFGEWMTVTARTVGGARAAWIALGLLYVGIPTAGLVLLRIGGPEAWIGIVFIFAIVWATDTAAYFGGRTIGGPKLWPRISPNKTWSGAVAGLLAGIVAGALVAAASGAPLVAAAVLAAVLSVASQAGDLLESAFKRRFSVKDSGSLIPGHGGVLDRIDGLYGAAAAAWILSLAGFSGPLFGWSGAAA
ncbi:phosphatidate cytidylyltransferase [Propylenella binzhouense]|uniref:phosphatidate cytidylyltransferase n=1 Tax=Propylenella binzhouense TaxID=2555902 RepID=UPI0031B5F73E